MYVGVDYYPEHWPQSRWPTDAKLMREAGFNVVRLAEFAWAFMEPEEGRFEFDWLDKALEILGENGISVILGTPTAVMPAWVAAKYPEVLAVNRDGKRATWGVRKNNCFSAGTYRLLSERITAAMAVHYAGRKNVIGWQTDNEFGHPYCHCATCRAEFQAWLRRKYGTLAKLNTAWGTHFWGHCYSEWAEIVIPEDDGTHNPGMCLDFHRFFSWQNARFQADQVKILRHVCPKQFVTHNFMGLFNELDYYELAEPLDHVSWDNYPVWGKPDIPYDSSAAADVMRGLKRQNFWIMEQTAGPGGWSTYGRNPWPGEIRKVAMQQVAHGADGMIWFRWRSCTAGREQYWHGLLGHDGKPFRRYREAAATATDLHKLTPALQGTTPKAKVAMLYDYDNIWALRIQPGYPNNTFIAAMNRFYRPCFRAGVNVDMIKPTQDLAGYKVILAPDLFIMPDALAKRLSDFVAKGGILVSDCRTGVKTETNMCHDRTLPGLLSDVFGMRIEEYEAIPDGMTYTVQGGKELPGTFAAVQSADWLTAESADTLAGYTDKHMRAFAAATRNPFRKGYGYYVGSVIKEEAFYDALIADVLAKAKLTPAFKAPLGVEVASRSGGGNELVFLINHTLEAQTVAVPYAGAKDLLTGKTVKTDVVLEPFGVAVLKV